METINKIGLLIVVFIIIFTIGFIFGQNYEKEKYETNCEYVINKEVLDSIDKEISYREYDMFNYYSRMNDEIEEANNSNDSVVINLFKQLICE